MEDCIGVQNVVASSAFAPRAGATESTTRGRIHSAKRPEASGREPEAAEPEQRATRGRGSLGSASLEQEMPNVDPFAARMGKAMQIVCPFCKAGVPPPSRVTKVFTPDGCLAERCSCGAVYAVDETGHLGGQALLDAQAVLCDGDLRLAISLESGRHVDVRSRPFRVQAIRGGARRFNRVSRSARAYFVRRRAEAEPAGS